MPNQPDKFNNGLPLSQKQIDDMRVQMHITPASSGGQNNTVQNPEMRLERLKNNTYDKPEAQSGTTKTEQDNNNSTEKDLFGKSKILNGITDSEQAVGNDLTAGARAKSAAESSQLLNDSQFNTEKTLSDHIKALKAAGQDTTHAEKALEGIRANSIANNGDISADVPEVNKTNEQGIGDVLGVGADALAFGGLGGTSYGVLKGGANAMSNNKGVGGVIGEAALSGLVGKVLDLGFQKASPFISDALSKYGAPLYEKLAQYIPEGAKDAMKTLADKATIGTGKGGTDVLENIDKKMGNAIEKPLNAIADKTSGLKDRMVQKARTALEKNYNDIFTQTKASTKQLVRSTEAGKNPSKLLADKGYIVDIEGGKLNTAPTVNKLHSDAEELIQILDQAVQEKASDPNVGPIGLNNLENSALESVNNPQTKRMGIVKDMQNRVKQEFQNYRDIYGDSITIKDANEIKKGQWEKTKYFNPQDPGYVKDVNNQIGHVFKDAVEKEFGDDFPVQRLNQYIGDHYDAINLLDKINGNVVKGGRLGNYLTKALGTAIGSHAGGPLGGVAGYMAGDLLNDLMTKSAIADPLKKYILENYADKLSPSVVKEATAQLGNIKKPRAS